MTIIKLSEASKKQGLATAIRVLETEAKALQELAGFINESFVQAVEMIFAAEGRLIVVSQVTRDQRRNLDDARDKVRVLVERAMVRPRPRIQRFASNFVKSWQAAVSWRIPGLACFYRM